MSQQSLVQILQVERKPFVAKSGPRAGQAGTIFKVKASDGNTYDTFDAAVGQSAEQFSGSGQTVVLEHIQSVRNGYQQFDLKGVTLAGSGAVPVQAIVSHSPAMNGQPSREDSIIAQSAYKAACELAAGVYNGSGAFKGDVIQFVREVTDELVARAKTGQWPSDEPDSEPVAVATTTEDNPWGD